MGQILVGAPATVILVLASLSNLMIGRPEVATSPFLIFLILAALVTLIWGIVLFKQNQVSHRAAMQEAYLANLRIQNDLYCSRCDITFAPKN